MLKNKRVFAIIIALLCAVVLSSCTKTDSFVNSTIKTHTAYYPTEEEYLEYYCSYFNITRSDLVKKRDSNANCTTVTWHHGYAHDLTYYENAPTFTYNVGLFENESGRVTWCSSGAYNNSFTYDFYYRCSEADRKNIIADVARGAYVLACYHNGEDYDFAVFNGLASNAANSLLSSGEFVTEIYDCAYYMSITDSGITSMLDYEETNL